MQPRDEVAVARAQPQRILAENRGRGRAAVRGLDDGEDDRAPAALVQARAELDVLVVSEETGIERALADGLSSIERGGGGNAPGGLQGLPNRPIRNIDP